MVGRKRHILVDTLGLLIASRVEPAHLHDQRGAKELAGLAPLQPRLAVVYADGAYAGAHLRDWCAAHAGVELRVVRRPDRHRFVVIPKRWIVERTFAWLGRNRRLAKDYEARPQTTEVLMAVAMFGLMLRRLARSGLGFPKHPVRLLLVPSGLASPPDATICVMHTEHATLSTRSCLSQV